MLRWASIFAVGLAIGMASPAVSADDNASRASGCTAVADDFFRNEVWAKVAAQSCLKCHKKGGDAEKSQLVLLDPQRSLAPAQDEAFKHNREAFAKVAQLKEKEQSRLLLKVVGELDHGGVDVLKADSAGYRILADFVRRVNGTPARVPTQNAAITDKNAAPFFDGVTMIDDRKLLRRVTLSLAGRLPTDAERAAVAKAGLKAFPALLDDLMKEEAVLRQTSCRMIIGFIRSRAGRGGGSWRSWSFRRFSTGWRGCRD